MKRIIKRITKIVIIVVLAIVLVAALGLGYFTIVEYNPKDIEPLTINNNAEPKVELDTDIAVLTFNIGYAGLGKDEDFVLDGGKRAAPTARMSSSATSLE